MFKSRIKYLALSSSFHNHRVGILKHLLELHSVEKMLRGLHRIPKVQTESVRYPLRRYIKSFLNLELCSDFDGGVITEVSCLPGNCGSFKILIFPSRRDAHMVDEEHLTLEWSLEFSETLSEEELILILIETLMKPAEVGKDLTFEDSLEGFLYYGKDSESITNVIRDNLEIFVEEFDEQDVYSYLTNYGIL